MQYLIARYNKQFVQLSPILFHFYSVILYLPKAFEHFGSDTNIERHNVSYVGQ